MHGREKIFNESEEGESSLRHLYVYIRASLCAGFRKSRASYVRSDVQVCVVNVAASFTWENQQYPQGDRYTSAWRYLSPA